MRSRYTADMSTPIAVTLSVDELEDPRAYPYPVTEVRVVQTHISWVCLAGSFAYKIKKPVDFGFLDFSTLARRKALCAAEVMLNRRFAPELYIGVVPIVRVDGGVRIEGVGEAIEWAVKMRRFPQSAQLDECLARGELSAEELRDFAVDLAAIHDSLPQRPPGAFGSASAVWNPVAENFHQIAATTLRTRCADVLARLEAWSDAQHLRLIRAFNDRLAAGFVRECHGDLHLSNLVRLDAGIVAFDCIEFSAGLRWIDVISDVAFLVMDLEMRGRRDLASAFLDRYLQASGDYQGARLLRYYRVYRSLVRAKVAALQYADTNEQHACIRRFDAHVAHAGAAAFTDAAALFLTCGVSGSGKSWLSERLVPLLPAIRIRSDVERKRDSGSEPAHYGAADIARVYDKIARDAAAVVAGGTSVIVDATFLTAPLRDRFARVARRSGVAMCVIYTTAPRAVLESRIRSRNAAGTDPSDADVAVLAGQLEVFEEPSGAHVVRIDTSIEVSPQRVAREIVAAIASAATTAASP